MQQPQEINDWATTWAYLKAFVPVVCVLLAMHLQNRSSAKKEKKEREIKEQTFQTLLREHPIHSHVEQTGALHVPGIRYPKG